MAFSLNRIMLLGRLGKDAETRFTANNLAITSFGIATDHNFKGKDGNWQTETTWHNVVAFGLSDYYKDNLKKGKRVYVEGRLTKRDYTDKEGIKRYSTEVFCERIIPIDATREAAGEVAPDYSTNIRETGSAQPAGMNNNTPDLPIDENDDLPF
ncbi:MAG: single-stranded DNA-binding protein [Ignavibacteria bacterium]|jgi:single-strand DNA-binding protein|nr:single-stranded DNA-binding protein [Ignavibacteria bacterium]MCU7501571.1 single-stranded DNA-binding protein [Ignavibacteria bacterium]MCU7517108.1 single-stranded DNA-binding protein [Ignavibacteria bacterium]